MQFENGGDKSRIAGIIQLGKKIKKEFYENKRHLIPLIINEYKKGTKISVILSKYLPDEKDRGENMAKSLLHTIINDHAPEIKKRKGGRKSLSKEEVKTLHEKINHPLNKIIRNEILNIRNQRKDEPVVKHKKQLYNVNSDIKNDNYINIAAFISNKYGVSKSSAAVKKIIINDQKKIHDNLKGEVGNIEEANNQNKRLTPKQKQAVREIYIKFKQEKLKDTITFLAPECEIIGINKSLGALTKIVLRIQEYIEKKKSGENPRRVFPDSTRNKILALTNTHNLGKKPSKKEGFYKKVMEQFNEEEGLNEYFGINEKNVYSIVDHNRRQLQKKENR